VTLPDATIFDTPGALPLVLRDAHMLDFSKPPWWLARELNWIGFKEAVWTPYGPKVIRQRAYCWQGKQTSVDAWRLVKYGPPRAYRR
jgi:hypothetical protein